jgi:two-component sensor histidine kinase
VVSQPASRGYGTRLLEAAVTQELGGTVRLSYAPEGLEVEMVFPVEDRPAASA